MVELYDDRLEISNPGGLLPIVARNFGHMSKSRNPKLFKLFTRMDLVEKVGSGIPRMADLMQEAGFPAPEYQTEGFFTTVLYKNKNTVKETGKKTIKKTGKKMPEGILEIIKESPQITVSDIAEQCGLTYTEPIITSKRCGRRASLRIKATRAASGLSSRFSSFPHFHHSVIRWAKSHRKLALKEEGIASP